MNNGIFPSSQIQSIKEFEEERRIAYVAYTRAIKQLHLSEKFTKKGASYPSQFIFEIGSTNRIDCPAFPRDFEKRAIAYYSIQQAKLFKSEEQAKQEITWQIGEKASHKLFGTGIIQDITQDKKIVFCRDDGRGTETIADPTKLHKIQADSPEIENVQICTTIPSEKTALQYIPVVETNCDGIEHAIEAPDIKAEEPSILEIINSITGDPANKGKVFVAPFICGSGKSTAISEKIMESIQKNEGLLVLTDRVERMESYFEPYKEHEKLYDFMKHRAKGFYTLMKKENAQRSKVAHKRHPVLLMTTQRFFKLSEEEILEYLSWDNGFRETILIDEKPEFFSEHTLTENEVDSFTNAFIKIGTETGFTEEQVHFLEFFWKPYSDSLKNEQLACPDIKANSYNYFIAGVDSDVPSAEIDDIPAEFQASYRDYLDSFEEKKDHDLLIQSMSRELNNILPGATDIYKHVRYLNDHQHISCFESKKKQSFEWSAIENNEHKLANAGAVTIIFDGTAPISIDYRQEYLNWIQTNQFDRDLQNLHIVLVDAEGTSRDEMTAKKGKEYFDKFQEFVNLHSRTKESCIFSYKQIQDLFETDVDGDYIDEKLKQTYLGNLRGRNDIQEKYEVFAQVGPNIYSSSYYLTRLMHLNPSWYSTVTHNQNAALLNCAAVQKYMKTDEYFDAMYSEVLADIEQNIFRSKIRNPYFTGKITYYLFINFTTHKRLREMIIDRFQNTYHAVVTDFGRPLLWDYVKIKRKQTIARKIIDCIDALSLGAEFEKQDLYKSISMTKAQFEKAVSKDRCRLLYEFFVRSKKHEMADGIYIKRFDLKDIDTYITEHPEPEYED